MLLIVTRSVEARRQLLLDRLEIVRQVLQADLAVVTVFLYLMEDGPPDRHLARAVRGHSFISSDDLLDACSREGTSIALCDRREVKCGPQQKARQARSSLADSTGKRGPLSVSYPDLLKEHLLSRLELLTS